MVGHGTHGFNFIELLFGLFWYGLVIKIMNRLGVVMGSPLAWAGDSKPSFTV